MIQIDMEMPTNCGNCPCFHHEEPWHCQASDEKVKIPDPFGHSRPLFCPLRDPNADVGEWTTRRTYEHDGEWYCSKCGYEPIIMTDDMAHCPGCGRKMLMQDLPKEEP